MPVATVRRLGAADIPAADRLLRAAFAVDRSYVARLERYLAIEPDAWFAAERDGTLVGTLGAVRYGDFAYLGLMSVDPTQQKTGLGRLLLEHVLAWLDARGVGCAVLDATVAGAPLYEKLGFVDVGITHELSSEGRTLAPPACAAGVHVVDATADDLPAIVALDRAAFGAGRAHVLARLVAERPDRLLVARRAGADGPIDGYLHMHEPMLGPWAARTPAAAHTLLAEALARPARGALRVQVPDANPLVRPLLLDAGFVDARVTRHMRRGRLALAPTWTEVYSKACYCLG
jgi:predicted N-acetyltransferase YhbS